MTAMTEALQNDAVNPLRARKFPRAGIGSGSYRHGSGAA